MGMAAKRLNLRCFLDGLEVPVIGARCTFTEGGPATAQIQLVATDAVYDIPIRTLVQLYVYEDYDFSADNEGVPRAVKLSPQDPRRYKLLFQGELSGVQLQQSSSSRAVVASAIDFTSYWDFIKQHYVNFSNGGIELFENAFLGVRRDRIKNFDVVTKGAHSNLYTWLTQSQVEVDGERFSNLYLGVQRTLREMFFASNNFYARAFNRLRLGDQIVGLPQDKTAAKLFKLDFFVKFIRNTLGGTGGMVSMRQLLELLLGTVFHTYVTVPFPRFDRTGEALGLNLRADNPQDEALLAEIIDRQAHPGASLNSTIIKPDTSFLVPPLCNVIFPHQYNSLAYQRDYLAEPTRLFLRTSLIFTGANKWLTERFYAPDFEAFNQLLYQRGGYLRRMSQVILPHEELGGLNPVMIWQNELGAYVQKGARREYLARLADYMFWKYRFAGRVLNVSMPFNMNLVPGYPALVLKDTGRGATTSRHFLGNIKTLVHSIDQTGGWTHMTMTDARFHDEVEDYDGTGRPLEEVVARGADGFLDDRYDPDQIGSVYQTLFGIESLLDLRGILNASDGALGSAGLILNVGEETAGSVFDQLIESLDDSKGPVVNAVAQLEVLYRAAVAADVDLETFVQSLTQRPKADLTEVNGFEDPADGEGFMSVAVSADAGDFANDRYQEVQTVVNYVEEEREIQAARQEIQLVGDEIRAVDIPAETETQRVARSTQVTKTGSYDLAVLLARRQAFVRAYIESLSDRGLRG